MQVKVNPEQMLHVVTHPLQVKANPEQMLHVVTHPLQCDLCNVSLTDQMSAKVHFESLIQLNKVVYQQMSFFAIFRPLDPLWGAKNEKK